MNQHIKKCKKRSKNQKKFIVEGLISSSTDLSDTKYEPEFNIKLTGDVDGWYNKLSFKASPDGTWTEELHNKEVLTMENFDGEIIINLDYMSKKQTIYLDIALLGDIVTAAQTYNFIKKNKVFNKSKIKLKK